MSDQTLAEFLAARDAAFIGLDLEWARARAKEACGRTGRSMPSDETLLASLHKARYDCCTLPESVRHESYYWLRERGLGRSCGLPLLPEGKLEYGDGVVKVNALGAFLATFVAVFALGFQSQNVNQGHYTAAALTSLAIGVSSIALYKVMPDSSWPEILGYLVGGVTGITASMYVHRRTLGRKRP